MNDTEKKFYGDIAVRMRTARDKAGFKQDDIVKMCKSRFGIIISQGTVSKILHGKISFPMDVGFALCSILGIDFAQDSLQKPAGPEERKSGTPGVFAEKNLISNPKKSVFDSYLGHEYDIFFLSTISYEDRLIQGELTFSNKENKICAVNLKIFATDAYVKEYTGKMVISEKQKACYCTVNSEKIGESGVIFFRHRFATGSEFKCAMAVAATFSAGKRNPAVHRMFICKKGVVTTDMQRDFIASQLLLNNSRILISASAYDKIAENKDERDIYEIVRGSVTSEETFYSIEERDAVSALIKKRLGVNAISDILTKLRKNSVSQRYNKVGEICDDRLYYYFFKR